MRPSSRGSLLLPALLALLACGASAAVDGGLPGSFTRFGAGARAGALGGTFGGVADDATAIYWNPAGLSKLEKPELNATHVSLFEQTSDEYAAFALPMKRYGGFAAAYRLESSGGFEGRATPFDAPTSFSVVNSMAQAAWGVKLPAVPGVPGALRLGVGAKRVEEQIGSSKASGVGGDAGLLYQPTAWFSLGVLYQNALAPKITFTRPVTFARVLEVTPTYSRSFSKDYSMNLAARATFYGGRPHPGAGLELWYSSILALRVGGSDDGLSAGVGLRFGNYELDYASQLNAMGPAQMVTLGIRFGRTAAEVEEEIKRGMRSYSRNEARRLAADYYRQALEYIEQDDFAKALSYLETGSLWDPENKEIAAKLDEIQTKGDQAVDRKMVERLVDMAVRAYDQGDYVASQVNWRGVLELDPANGRAKRNLRLIDKKLGKKEKEQLRLAQERRARQRAQQHDKRASDLFREGKLAQARAEASQALDLDGQDELAQKIYADADSAIKGQAMASFRRGEQLFEARDYSQALHAYSNALKADPENARAREQLRACEAALASAGQTLRSHVEAEKLYYQAVNAYLNGHFKEAQETLTRVVALDAFNEGAKKLQAKLDAATGGGR